MPCDEQKKQGIYQMTITSDRPSMFKPAIGRVSKAAAFGAAALACFIISDSIAATPGITIENPFLRLIIKDRPAGGYFTLRNNTDKAIELTGATSRGCGMMMLHQSKEVNGVDKMLPVKRIKVPAHGAVSFAPGGYHLMCMKPQSAVAAGKTVPVILTFSDSKAVTANFPVKGPGG
jgi:copper(I)-binding protein